MSKQRNGKGTTLADLEVVPYEKSIPHYLEQHQEELTRRESMREEERRKARETVKSIVVGGPGDRTNKL